MSLNKKHDLFAEKVANWSDKDISVASLFVLWETHEKAEKTRKNTSKIVWILMIPILLVLLGYVVMILAYFTYAKTL